MTEATLKNGTLKSTEYFLIEIDGYGDAQNLDAYDTLEGARDDFDKFLDQIDGIYIQAIALERRIMYFPWDKDTTYHTFKTAGNEIALRAGGWIN